MFYQAEHPVWAMAFRPFYLLAAAYGAFSVLLWGFGYNGTSALPAQYWHAHEMIWGYAGAVVVAFLLTAVATWTGQPPVRGRLLMVLAALWLTARLAVFSAPLIGLTHLAGTLFFWLAAAAMGQAVVKSQNRRNYIAVAALFLFGLSHAVFHFHLHPLDAAALHHGLLAGLLMVAGFIGLIGNRIIPFFTARRLNTPQTASPLWLMSAALLLPAVAAVLTLCGTPPVLSGIAAAAAGLLGLIQGVRWFQRAILPEPMLWVLHAGYAACSLGLLIYGLSQLNGGGYGIAASLGIHLIAVGGIGLLTIGMMTRTALGHTGRPLYPAPHGLTAAFWLMTAAAAVRTLAALLMSINATAYRHSLRLSAVLFAAALLIYLWRYFPWLTRPRIDGKAG